MIPDPGHKATIAVIGCGNLTRRDDGVGSEVLRLLLSRGVASVSSTLKLLDAATDGAAVMFAARGCRYLVVIDACRSGAEPGAVFEIPGSELELRCAPPLGTHEFRWDHAIAAGRQLFREDFPVDVTVFLIEAESLEFGLGLTDSAATAAAKVVNRVEGLVRALLPVRETAA